MIFSVDLALYGVSHAKDLGIWGLWYNVITMNECKEIGNSIKPLAAAICVQIRLKPVQNVTSECDVS